MGAIGAELGWYGMRLEASPVGILLLITQQARILRRLKDGEDEKHFGPSQKEINLPF